MAVALLAKTGIVVLALGLVVGIVGFLMAIRPWPAYALRCRAAGERPALPWSSRYLQSLPDEPVRRSARRGILLHGFGLAVALLSFPFVMLSGLAE